MFELRRQRLVAGDGGPVVGEDFRLRAAKVDHRLDREEHPLFQHRALAGAAVMQDVRRGVEHPAQAVAAEIAHHRLAVRFGVRLDRVADITEGGAGADRLDPLHQAAVGDLDQVAGLGAGGARDVHARVVAVPAVHDHRHVDVQDVAIQQHVVVAPLFQAARNRLVLSLRNGLARYPVADDVVHADAACVLVAAIADGGAGRPGRLDPRADEIVKLARGDARLHQRAHLVQDRRRDAAGGVHAREILGAVNADALAGDARFVHRSSFRFHPR